MRSYKYSILWSSFLIPFLQFGCLLLIFIFMWDSRSFGFSLLEHIFPEIVKDAFRHEIQSYKSSFTNEFDKNTNYSKNCELAVYWLPVWPKTSRLDEVRCLHTEPTSRTLSRGKSFPSSGLFFSTSNYHRRLWCWDEVLEEGHLPNDSACRSLWLFSLGENHKLQNDWENCFTAYSSRSSSRNAIHFTTPTVPLRLQFWWVVEPSFSSPSHDSPGSSEKKRAFQKGRIPSSFYPPYSSPPLALLVRWMPNMSTLCPPPLTFLYAFSDVHAERVIISTSSTFSTFSSDLFSASQPSVRQQKEGNIEGKGETIDKYSIKIMCADWREDSRIANDKTTGKSIPRYAPAAIEIFLTTFWWDPFSSVPTIKAVQAASPIMRFRTKSTRSIVVASSSRFFSSSFDLPSFFSSFSSLTDRPRKYFHGFSPFDTPFGFVDNVLLLQQEHVNENVFVGVFSEILPTMADTETRRQFLLIDSGSLPLASATSSVLSSLFPSSAISGSSTAPSLSASFSSPFSPVALRSRWWVHRLDTPWFSQPLTDPSTASTSFMCYSPRFHLAGSTWHSNFNKYSSLFHLFFIHAASGSTKLLLEISSSALVSPVSYETSEGGESYVKKSRGAGLNKQAEDVHRLFHQCHFDEYLSANFFRIRVRLVVHLSNCMHYCLSSANDFPFHLVTTDPSATPLAVEWIHDVRMRCTSTERKELWEAWVTLQGDGSTVRSISPFQFVAVDHTSEKRNYTSFNRNGSLRNDEPCSSSFSHHEVDLRNTLHLRKESSRCAALHAWEWLGLPTTTESLFFFFSQWSCRLVHYSLYEVMILFFRFVLPIFVMLCAKELLTGVSSRR